MSWFWKHKDKDKKKVIIKQECYDKLPDVHKSKFVKGVSTNTIVTNNYHTHVVEDNDGDFMLSAAVGMATDNIALGYLAGGNLSGALVGEMISESSCHSNDFGGGDTGGGGAGDSYSQTDNSPSFDSTPSYDPTPSYDSSSSSDSSSYDSGSSSSYDSSSSSSDSGSSYDSGSSSSDSSF